MMLPSRPIQTNFTSGELSPRMIGRVDLDQYNNAAAELTNFQVLPQGGITRRPGSAYATTVKNSAGRVRLLPFTVSDLTAYVLELGAGYMRFVRNRGPVLDANGTPLELATPYAQAELREIVVAQSADVMYLTHGAHPPMKLQRTSASTFTLAAVAFANGPYDTENTGDVGAIGAPPASTAPEPAPAPAPAPPSTGTGGSDGGSGSQGGGEGGGAGDAGGDGGGGEGGGGEAEGGGGGE